MIHRVRLKGYLVTELDTGREFNTQIPIVYKEQFFDAKPGDRITIEGFSVNEEGRHFLDADRKIAKELMEFEIVEVER